MIQSGRKEIAQADWLEALSFRYDGRKLLHCFILRSGRIAVFGQHYELHYTCDTLDEAFTVMKELVYAPPPAPRYVEPTTTLNLSDLGL